MNSAIPSRSSYVGRTLMVGVAGGVVAGALYVGVSAVVNGGFDFFPTFLDFVNWNWPRSNG